MSLDIKSKVSRFITKSLDLRWPEDIVDFDSQCFCVKGIKPLVHVQDEIETTFVWSWSVKDYLIEELVGINSTVTKQMIENEINKYTCLVLCADIANGLKHDKLMKSRSGHFAKLSIIQTATINKDTVSTIHELGGNYYITPKSGNCVQVKASIVSCNGVFLLDAFECLRDSLIAWDEIHNKFASA